MTKKIKQKDEKMSIVYKYNHWEVKINQKKDEKDGKSWNIQQFQHNCNKFVVGLEMNFVAP